jgi:hypothetical protein
VNEVTDHTLPSHAHVAASPASSNTSLAWWAFRLTAGALVAIGAAVLLFAVADAVGGGAATSDNWVAVLAGVGLLAGLLASFGAFLLAAVAKLKHEQWLVLWLPLSIFPAVLAFLALGELFWWE